MVKPDGWTHPARKGGAQLIDIHVIITNDDHGFYVESPQLPGFSGARVTEAELKADFRAMMKLAAHEVLGTGVDYRIIPHRHVTVRTPENDTFVVRSMAAGDDGAERSQTASQIVSGLLTSESLQARKERKEIRSKLLPSLLGDVILVSALPTDTVRQVLATMYPQDDVITIVMQIADDRLWTIQVGTPMRDGSTRGWRSMVEAGITADMTIAELMNRPVEQRVLMAA